MSCNNIYLVVPVLNIFGEKLWVQLLCMIINTSSHEIFLLKHRHLGEMKPLSTSDDPVEPLMINEVTHATDSNQVSRQSTQAQNSPATEVYPPMTQNLCQKNSILMPGAIQVHRQVSLTDVKISKETKKLYEMLQKYKAKISKSDNNIG